MKKYLKHNNYYIKKINSKKKCFRNELDELRKYLRNHCQLFFALCIMKLLLLSTIFIQMYRKCRHNVQIEINKQTSVISLIKQQYFIYY